MAGRQGTEQQRETALNRAEKKHAAYQAAQRRVKKLLVERDQAIADAYDLGVTLAAMGRRLGMSDTGVKMARLNATQRTQDGT